MNEMESRLSGLVGWFNGQRLLVIVAIVVLFAFLFRWLTLDVTFSSPSTAPDANANLRILEARIDQLEQSQAAMLETVYFGLGVALAIGALLVGYGWFQYRAVIERQFAQMDVYRESIDERIKAAETTFGSLQATMNETINRTVSNVETAQKAMKRDLQSLQRTVEAVESDNKTRHSIAAGAIGWTGQYVIPYLVDHYRYDDAAIYALMILPLMSNVPSESPFMRWTFTSLIGRVVDAADGGKKLSKGTRVMLIESLKGFQGAPGIQEQIDRLERIEQEDEGI